MEASSIQETTNQQNLLLLVALRWVAVVGQVITIAVTALSFHIVLPIPGMACVLMALAAANIVSFYRAANGATISNGELFVQILIDVSALTLQLYLTGGASNPFVGLFLIQVILGAVLLQPVLSWSLVAVTTGCFVLLTVCYRDIGLAGHVMGPHAGAALVHLHRWGALIAFILAAALQVLFVTRISRNLSRRDARVRYSWPSPSSSRYSTGRPRARSAATTWRPSVSGTLESSAPWTTRRGAVTLSM